MLEDVVTMIANEQNKLATVYLDDGKLTQCYDTLTTNSAWLDENAKKLKSKKLEKLYELNVRRALVS